MRYRFTPAHRYYRASLRAVNTICAPYGGPPRYGSWTTIEFQVHYTQTGTIYLDTRDDAVVDANGRCVSPTVPALETEPGVNASQVSILSQRDNAAWRDYNFDGWGFVWRSNWTDIISGRTLGTPVTPSANQGGPDSIVDNNFNTFWSSRDRGEDTHHLRVGYEFNTPQPIQVIAIHEYNNPAAGIRAAPHTGADPGRNQSWPSGASVRHVPGPSYKTFHLSPGFLYPRFYFNTFNTGFGDGGGRDRWGVAEIAAYINPNPTPQLQVTYNGTEVANTGGWTHEGDFTITTPAGAASQLELNMNSDEFTCSCPEGCRYNVSGANANMHFFINVKADPWFQIHDGAVAAYGDSSLAISNPIPEQCTAATNCSPVLIRTPNSTAPAIMTGGGTVDMSKAPGQQTTGIDDENRNWLARLSSTPARQDFAYFRRIYKFPSAGVQDDFALNFNNATKPSASPANGGSAYYHLGDLTITSDWTVNSGESYVILVDGDVNVQAEISVAQGGFLAFVASGDVVFDAALGSNVITSTDPVVEGVFIANGKISLPASQLKFVGAGTFVGWNGFDLLRDYNSTDNWSAPTELFIYRPDLLQNAPEEMKTPRYEWNEVNP